MKFRTEIPSEASAFQIDHKTPILMMGSCFTDNIGEKLKEQLFPIKINPFGVVYNPFSVFQGLEIIMHNKKFSEEDLFEHDGLWHSWHHHSAFSAPDKSEVLKKINAEIEESYRLLKTAKYLILTFGTAWAYHLKSTQSIVGNCHKVPSHKFERKLAEVSEIVNEFQSIREQLNKFNPEIRTILTVSPVRHWKDGAHGNQVSKSILHLSIHRILQNIEKSVEYFPSYEIMMDDLRDYRFFSDDLLHPNNQAIEYIYEKFEGFYFDKKTISLNTKIDKLLKASKHKLFDKESEKSKAFIEKQIANIQALKNDFPFLNTESLLSGIPDRK